MAKKILNLFLVVLLVLGTLSLTVSAAPQATANSKVDTVTSASVIDNQDAFIKAIGKSGSWLVAITKDIKCTKPLVVEGQFKNKGVIARELALYNSDKNFKVTARYTLTAPKLTIKSENTSIKNGTFVGDIYVEAKGFTVSGATIKGNVYFADEATKKAFKLDKGKITGKQSIKK